MEFDKTQIYVQLQHPAQPASMEIYIYGNIFWQPRKFTGEKEF